MNFYGPLERDRRSMRSLRVGCDFSKTVQVSGRTKLDVYEFGRAENFFGASRRTVDKYRYVLLAYICKYQNIDGFILFVLSVRSLFVLHSFPYCIQCFQFQVYIAEAKCREHLQFLTYNLIYIVLRGTNCTVYALLKNLHLNSLNQKVYMTYNNKDIDACLYTIPELIYDLFMHQTSLYILYEQG